VTHWRASPMSHGFVVFSCVCVTSRLSALCSVADGSAALCSSAAKRLDEGAVHMAVVAHVLHHETHYDALLARGVERWEARDRVREEVDRVLSRWRKA
jgi:hypothetical protein